MNAKKLKFKSHKKRLITLNQSSKKYHKKRPCPRICLMAMRELMLRPSQDGLQLLAETTSVK